MPSCRMWSNVNVLEVLAGRRLIPVSSTSQFRTLRLLPGGHYPQGVNVHPVTDSRTVAFPQLIADLEDDSG